MDGSVKNVARATARRLGTLALAGLLVLPTGCASGRGTSGGAWMAGMMGVMVVGGLVLGRGLMHGGGRASHQEDAFTAERFQPARLLEQRALLELTDDQVAALEALRDEVAEGRRTAEDAARAAYDLLRPVQRAAVGSAGAGTPRHH